MFYPANHFNNKQNYKFLSGSVIPRPIAWITSLTPDKSVVNAAPFSFYNVVASKIPLVAVAVMREENGTKKHTAINILKNHQAVVQVSDFKNRKAVNKTSASLAGDESEIKLANLKLEASRLIAVPRIKGTKIQFETKLHQYLPLKDNSGVVMTDLLLLEILGYHFADEVFDRQKQYLKEKEIDPISRLAGNSFAKLGKEFILKRPR